MIITLTAYRRPYTLERIMESFHAARKQLDEPIYLFAGIEPCEGTDARNVGTILKHEEANDIHVTKVNTTRLGLQANAYWTMQWAWNYADRLGEDFILHGEDDRLLAPDALVLAAWMRDEYRSDEEVAFVTMKGLLNPNPEDSLAVMKHRGFTTGWFGYWHRTWKDLIVEGWDHGNSSSFDQNLEDEMLMRDQVQVHPVVSRSRHLWEDGEHAVHYTSGTGDPARELCLFAGDIDIPDEDYWELKRG